MRKTAIIIAIVLAVIIFALLAAVLFIPAKRTIAPVNQTPEPAVYKDGSLLVTSPLPNSVITSPLVVEGRARGTWYFEASFPVRILDGDGTVLGQVPAQAQSDWMTLDFVPFKATIEFTPPKFASGTLVLENDNPSGMPENSKELRIPVRFDSSPTKPISVPPSSSGSSAPPKTSGPSACKPTGCSGEICSDQNVASTCIYKSEYACYKTAKCERQVSGECGWTQTQELQSCLKNAAKTPAVY